MIEVRKLIKEDIFEIRDNLIEPEQRHLLTDEIALFGQDVATSYTYLKDGKVVGCCGGSKMKDGLVVDSKEDGVWQMWALYAKDFTAMTIGRCAKAFSLKFRDILKGDRGEFGVPVGMCHCERYAKFLGGVFVKKQKCKITGGKLNIYEVA